MLAGAVAVSVPARFAQLAAECSTADCHRGQLSAADFLALRALGIPAGVYAGYVTTLEAVIAVGYLVLAGAILWRGPDDRVALFASFALATVGVTASETIQAHLALGVVASVVEAAAYTSVVLFLAVFPDGRFVPRWVLPVVAAWSAWRLSMAILPPGDIHNLVMLPSYGAVALAGFFTLGVIAQIVRYRGVSSQAQRQQTKWVVFGCAMSVLGVISYVVPPALLPAVQVGAGEPRVLYLLAEMPFRSLALLFAPATIAISIGRHRLWDVDHIINRALVYGLLTVGLAAMYSGIVVGLQRAFVALTGAESDVAVVASTLAIAALFAPLRGGLQVTVDRRFYRRKYDAMQVLAEIGKSAREEVDIDRLTEQMLESVREAIQPADTRIWLVRQSGIRGAGR